jgi:hypothetical protein
MEMLLGYGEEMILHDMTPVASPVLSCCPPGRARRIIQELPPGAASEAPHELVAAVLEDRRGIVK